MRLDDGLKAPRREFDGTAIRVVKRAALDAERTADVKIEPGTTIGQALRLRAPSLTDDQIADLRVVSLHDGEQRVIERKDWGEKLKPGAFLVVTDPPMGSILRSVLQIVIAVAAFAIATFVGGPLGALAAAAFAFGANYLLNKLIPARGANDKKQSPTYSLSGFQNRANLDGPIPLVVGSRHRFAPPFAVPPYIEVVNGKIVLSAVFCCGFAPMGRWNEKLGDRLLSRFRFFETEYRGFADEAGTVDNSPFSLVTETVIQKAQQIELRYKDVGIDEDDDEALRAEPTILETAPDSRRIRVIFSFPGGLANRSKKKGKLKSRTVTLQIRKRLVTPGDTGAWVTIETLSITKKKSTQFFHQWEHDFGADARGGYEVSFLRMNDDDSNEREQSRIEIMAFQSILPEYPINPPAGVDLSMVSCRIRATNQLQGNLDEYNLEGAQLIEALNPSTGLYEPMKETGNPADWKRHIESMPIQARPVALTDQNDAEIRAWHAHNVANGLTFSRVYDYEVSVQDMLLDVCAAGRAVPRMTNGLRGVSVNEPKDELGAYPLTPHNSWGFEGAQSYGDFAHAFRVKGKDRNNNFKDFVRDVVRPGYTGPVTKFDILEPPGMTDPTEAYVHGYLTWLEVLHRAATYTVSMDWEARMLQHGDLVLLMHRVLHKSHDDGFVTNIVGKAVALSETVTIEAGKTYAIKFRELTPDGSPTPARMVTWAVKADPGERRLVTIVGEGDLPEKGALYSFGEAEALNVYGVIQNVEPTEGGCGRLTVIPYAGEIIFPALDALTVPPYSSRIGAELPVDTRPPAVPSIEGTNSSEDVYDEDAAIPDNPRRIVVYPKAGEGVPAAYSFEVRHRKASEGTWRTPVLAFRADAGSAAIETGYAKGDAVVLQPRALSRLGTPSEWGDVFPHTVGEADSAGPEVTSFSASATLGGVITVAWTSGTPDATAKVRILAGTTGNYADLAPAHTGYLTASPSTLPGTYPAGTYRVGIQLEDEDGDLGAPAYAAVTVAAETPPLLPEELAASINSTTGRLRLSARAGTDDPNASSLIFKWGPQTSTFATALSSAERKVPVNTAIAVNDTVAAPVGGIRSWVQAKGFGGALGPVTDPVDIYVPGEALNETFPYADGALDVVGAANWTQMVGASGAASVFGNRLRATGTGSFYVAKDLGSFKAYVQSEIRFTTSTSNCFLALFIDQQNYIAVRCSGGQLQLVQRLANVTTTVANPTMALPAVGTVGTMTKDQLVLTVTVGSTTINYTLPSGLLAASKPGVIIATNTGADFIDNFKAGVPA